MQLSGISFFNEHPRRIVIMQLWLNKINYFANDQVDRVFVRLTIVGKTIDIMLFWSLSTECKPLIKKKFNLLIKLFSLQNSFIVHRQLNS